MLADMDRAIMGAMQALDGFAATYTNGVGQPEVECQVLRDTLEVTDEYGVATVSAGAVVNYLASDVRAKIGGWFVFDNRRYIVENLVPTQDSSWRQAHCRVEVLSG